MLFERRSRHAEYFELPDQPALETDAIPFIGFHAGLLVLKKILQTTAFFTAYLIFGGVGLVVSVLCRGGSIFFEGARSRNVGQKLIHGLFAFFVGLLRHWGLVKIDTGGLSALQDQRGLILTANHPSLLDAVFVVSQLPQVVCLMKGSLVRNPVLCGTASLAGYVDSRSPLSLIKHCAGRLKEGANLLIFPEGTRSVNGRLHAFKMGFALIATRTGRPVQTIIIDVNCNYLGKGWPFFKPPAFPLRYSLRLGERFEPAADMNAKDFGNQVEEYYRSLVARPDGCAVASSL